MPHSSRALKLAVVSVVVCLSTTSLRSQEPGTVVAADKRVQGKSYVFKETGKQLPYALFVPSKYDATKKWPLVVGLHGLGRPYDWVMGYDGMIDFAERDGYVMVTPLGTTRARGTAAADRMSRSTIRRKVAAARSRCRRTSAS